MISSKATRDPVYFGFCRGSAGRGRLLGGGLGAVGFLGGGGGGGATAVDGRGCFCSRTVHMVFGIGRRLTCRRHRQTRGGRLGFGDARVTGGYVTRVRALKKITRAFLKKPMCGPYKGKQRKKSRSCKFK